MNEFTAAWSEQLVRACGQSAVVAAVVFVVLVVWRRAPSRLRCGLWWLVGLKMLIGLAPVTVALAVLPREPVEATTVQTYSVSEFSQLAGVSELVSPEALSTVSYLFIAWLVVGGILAFGAIRPALKLRRVISQAEPNSDQELIAISIDIASTLNLRRTPPLLVTQEPYGPLTFGIVRPVILIPQSTLNACSHEEMRWIVAHEMAHVRRCDPLLGLVPQLAQIAFWFNPIVWLAGREYTLAREAACDEVTMQVFDTPCDRYARLLLKLGTAGRPSLCVPGVSPHFRTLQRRILMLEKSARSSSFRRFAPLAMLACAAAMLPISLVAQTAPTPPTALVQQETPVAAAMAPTQAVRPDATPAAAATRRIPAKSGTVTVFTLRRTKANSVAKTLRAKFPSKKGSPVKILVDEAMNAIVIQANPNRQQQIAEAVTKLERAATRGGQTMIQAAPIARVGSITVRARDGAVVATTLKRDGGQPAIVNPAANAPAIAPARVSGTSVASIPAQTAPAITGATVAGGPAETTAPGVQRVGAPPVATTAPAGIQAGGAATIAPAGIAADATRTTAAPTAAAARPFQDATIAVPMATTMPPRVSSALPKSVTMVSMIQLHHVNAAKTAKVLTSKFGDKQSKIWSDTKNNAVLIKGSPAKVAKIAAFLAKYDAKK